MRTVRIHIDAPLTQGASLLLPPPQAVHVARVLRMRAGEHIVLFNGDGRECAAVIEAAHQDGVRVNIESARTPVRESTLQLTLAQALARGEKMDWIVQKATELGAARITPLVTERSEVRLDAARMDKRSAHWRAIAIAAAEQCGRTRLPDIGPPLGLDMWLGTCGASARAATRLMLHPTGGIAPRALDARPRAIVLAVGPEGGFGDRDLTALRFAGFVALTLGPRILRTETAGLAAMAALQALYGDL